MKSNRILGALTAAVLLASPAPARADEQANFLLPDAGPHSMADLVDNFINPALRAIASCHWGAGSPTNGPSGSPILFQCWANTTTNPVLIERWDGAQWVVEGALNTSTHVWTPYRNGAPIVAVATSGSASDLTTGTLPAARLPLPSASTLGGVESIASLAHNWIAFIDTSGVPHQSQPACGDLSNSVASCSTDTTNAANISSGTLPTARLPAPTASTLGGVESIASLAHNWIAFIDTSGVPHQSQPSFADISGSVAASQLPNPSASTLGGVESITSLAHNWIAFIDTSGVPHQSQPSFADISGTNAIGAGGTGQTSAAAARGSSGLNIEGATSTGDANYAILSTDRMVYHTALSAARTDTLPAASALNPGQMLIVADFDGVATAIKTVTITANGTDTVNGLSSISGAIGAQFGAAIFWSDGVSKWTFFPASTGGSSGVTAVVILGGTGIGVSGGCSITTSGTCTINLTTPVSSPNGGSGVASPAAHTVPINEGSSAQNNTGTGTLNQTLVSGGASADPAFKSGARLLLETLTGTGPSVSTTISWSGFNSIEIEFDVVPVTSGTNFLLQVSNGTLLTSGYSGNSMIGSTTATAGQTAPTTAFLLCNNNSGGVVAGITRLLNIGSASTKKQISQAWSGNFVELNSGTSSNTGALIGGTFSFSSGNISSGTIRIYGIM